MDYLYSVIIIYFSLFLTPSYTFYISRLFLTDALAEAIFVSLPDNKSKLINGIRRDYEMNAALASVKGKSEGKSMFSFIHNDRSAVDKNNEIEQKNLTTKYICTTPLLIKKR